MQDVNCHHQRRICSIERNRQLLSLFVIGVLIFSSIACNFGIPRSTPEPAGEITGTQAEPATSQISIEPVEVIREPEPQVMQIVNAAVALSLRQYVFARLMTEAFVTADFESMPDEELAEMVDELVIVWDTTGFVAGAAEELTDRALTALQASIDHPRTVAGKPAGNLLIMASATAPDEFDPQKWAESFTQQYDAIKGGQKIKQLAGQLGMDAKAVHAQLVLAQEIIYSQATRDAEFWDKMTKAAQATKTAAKVGLFVTATVATGGGTLTALAGSSMTIAQAGAVVVGGVDAIVDVAATGSNIFLGEDHQVTVAFEDVKDKLGPVSAVVGLATLDPTKADQTIAYVGESLMEWFSEGKVMGVKVTNDPTGFGAAVIQAMPLDIANADKDAVDAATAAMGLALPWVSAQTLSELVEEYRTGVEDAFGKLDGLVSEMAVIEQLAVLAEESDSAEDQSVGEESASGEKRETVDVSGTYHVTATVVSAKNDTVGEVNEFQWDIKQNSDDTLTLSSPGAGEFTGAYNPETGEFTFEYGDEVVLTYNITFDLSGETRNAKGTLTSNQSGEGWTREVALDLRKIDVVEKSAWYRIRNVSGTGWLLDSDTELDYYDGIDAVGISDFTVESGGSLGFWINVEKYLASGQLVETSATTYTITALIMYAPIPEKPEIANQTEDFYLTTFTINGTYGEDAVIEWDGSSFRQVE